MNKPKLVTDRRPGWQGPYGAVDMNEERKMNDIIDLAVNAGMLNYIDNETPRRYFIDGNADLDELNLFAKSLIIECAKVADDNYDKGLCPVGNFIKEHFGVNDE